MRLSLPRPLRPFPVADRSRDGELYEHMHPRIAAIRLLREKIADRNAGLDPYDETILVVDAREHEHVWVHRCLELTGVVVRKTLNHDGRQTTRYRALVEADVRDELGLDQPGAPVMGDEPLASRAVDATAMRVLSLQEGRLADEGPARAALERAHEAWALRYPNGVTEEVEV